MAQIIDISAKITNELPVVKITDDIVVTVNNRKSVILNIQAMALEAERKAKADESHEYDQMEFIKKALGMLVGIKKAEDIEALDLPIPEYQEVYQTLMAVASGTYGKENTPTV